MAFLLAQPSQGQEEARGGGQTGAEEAHAHPASDQPAAVEQPPSPEELARRIEALAAELEDLQLGEVAGKLESRWGLGPAASKVYGVDRGFSFGGYGEMLYQNFAAEDEGDAPSGESDRIDFLRQILYVGYKYDEHILFNAELEFEHASTGKNGEVSVEFAVVEFLLQDALNARVGLLLVPMGWINELHEPPVFLGASRPQVERAIVPTTWRADGAGLFGAPGGRLAGLGYRAYVIESLASVSESGGFSAAGLRGGRQSGSEASIEDAAGVVRADYERRGVTVGGSVFFGNTAQGASVPGPAGDEEFGAFTTVYEGHLQLRHRGVQLRALFAGADVQDAEKINSARGLTGTSSVGSRLQGWYVEGGWEVLQNLRPGTRFALLPYARYEELNTQAEVPEGFAADPASDRRIFTAGAAFYPHAQVVFKADYELTRNEAETGVDRWNLALGYLF
jgi:hypothetical protein